MYEFTWFSFTIYSYHPSLLAGLLDCIQCLHRTDVCKSLELMCFKQERAISTISGKPLKLVEQFIYISSNILSTERDVNICPVKAWTAIDGKSIILKSDLSEKIKRISSELWLNQNYCMDAPPGCYQNARRKDWMGTVRECYVLIWTNPGCSNPQNCSCTSTYLPSHKPSK